ncbi:hypothetical protein EDD18DRAFT_1186254 [Armillaria luteobubalina]|uniref:Uncharacterized protein n=1 Tax=Armillaria luteobubalina TaxID=153913 RepID=A0AA39UKL7_9AGAR|nr:hypothetical protein EDD18DRAFT_1186254 [Armillaria luteobubalina]
MLPPSIPAASPQPIIPQELIDIIIDYLYNDTRSLRGCAVVSSSWSGRSQQHLFSRIALAGKLWPDKRKNRTSAELFLRLIESAPHIPSFVRHLDIIEGDAFRSYRWLAQSMPILDRILPTLTNLRTFHINFTGLLWRDIPGIDTSFIAISKLRDLRKVTISSVTSVPSLNGLFTLFEGSNITDICLVNVTSGAQTDGSRTYVPTSVRIPLQTLSLSLESNEVWRLSSWFADPSCILRLSDLRKLRINVVEFQEMRAASRLLDTLHVSSLEAIEIRLESLENADSTDHSESLPNLSNFRHIRFALSSECLLIEPEEWMSASVAAQCWERLLKNFRENIIETVTLTLPKIHPNRFPEAERRYWVALDATLTRADMSHLRRVYLEDENSQGMDYRVAVIKDILPNLYDKGLVVF